MESATAATTACCSSQPRAGSAIAVRHRKRRATEEVSMAEPFLSEIRIMSFNFPPKGWALCNGQQLPINQNQALFSLLGTTYGGNGQTTFALPNLRGQVPIHMGNGHTLGETAGSTAVTLNIQTLPQHIHFMVGSNTAGDTAVPPADVLALTPSQIYGDPVSLTTLIPN